MDYRLHDFLPLYNPIQTQTFDQDINSLTEFVQFKLDKTEIFPQHPGDLMLHQRLISTFINPHTSYGGLLLVHEMGCCVRRKKCRICLFSTILRDFFDYFMLV